MDRSAVERANTEVVAIVGGTILDGNGGAPINDGIILVDRKRIRAVGDRSIPIPSQVKQIRATGKFIIPGLISPYLYPLQGTWAPELIRYEGRYDEVAIESVQLALKDGVTTVFCCWGPRDPLIKARSAINEGRAIGARVYLCGNWIGFGGPYSADMGQSWREAVGEPFAARLDALWEAGVGDELTRMSLEEARQVVRRYVQSGIDYVGYLINSHRGALQHFTFSPRVQRMIVEEAHRAGLVVQAMFVTTEESIHLALDVGADIVTLNTWGKPMSAETVALLAQRRIPVSVELAPTSYLEWYRQNPNAYPGALRYTETAECESRALIRAGARLIDHGARQGAYSADQLAAWSVRYPPGHLAPVGQRYVRGLQALQEKGMTAMEVLMTATRNIAEVYKVDKDLGTLEAGKLADLIVLDRNPLENPQNYLSTHLVMKEGQVIDREALPTQRLWSAPHGTSN